MAQISYDLRLPAPRLPRAVRLPKIQPFFVSLISLLWLGIYGWLGYRLWFDGLRAGWRTNLVLAMIVIVSGVGIGLAWRNIGMRWITGLRSSGRWGALSLHDLQTMDPFAFEEYVAQRLFARQGYQVINTQDSKDGGVDILVTDPDGYDAVVQCKRYRGTVGSPTVRELYGTMVHSGVTRAFLVTSGTISDDARKWAADKPITLIDGQRLVELSRATAGLTTL